MLLAEEFVKDERTPRKSSAETFLSMTTASAQQGRPAPWDTGSFRYLQRQTTASAKEEAPAFWGTGSLRYLQRQHQLSKKLQHPGIQVVSYIYNDSIS
jgi:hypothetical protein